MIIVNNYLFKDKQFPLKVKQFEITELILMSRLRTSKRFLNLLKFRRVSHTVTSQLIRLIGINLY